MPTVLNPSSTAASVAYSVLYTSINLFHLSASQTKTFNRGLLPADGVSRRSLCCCGGMCDGQDTRIKALTCQDIKQASSYAGNEYHKSSSERLDVARGGSRKPSPRRSQYRTVDRSSCSCFCCPLERHGRINHLYPTWRCLPRMLQTPASLPVRPKESTNGSSSFKADDRCEQAFSIFSNSSKTVPDSPMPDVPTPCLPVAPPPALCPPGILLLNIMSAPSPRLATATSSGDSRWSSVQVVVGSRGAELNLAARLEDRKALCSLVHLRKCPWRNQKSVARASAYEGDKRTNMSA